MFCSALPAAVASLAVVLLAVAGCKIQAQSAAQAGASSASGRGGIRDVRHHPGRRDHRRPVRVVDDLIGRARHSIDVTMYEFSDATAEHDLAAAAARGGFT